MAAVSTARSMPNLSHPKGTGPMTALTPKISMILKMFDPTTFPTAISFRPLKAATAEVNSSGREVPAETTVMAISRSLTPILDAASTAAFTTKRPPNAKPTSPPAIKRIVSPGPRADTSTSSKTPTRAILKA